MTDHDDAARLAEIRNIASQLSPSPGDVRQALDDAVRLIDAATRPHDADDDLPIIPGRDPRTIKLKLTTCETPPPLPIEDDRPHDAEFVSRGMYGEVVAELIKEQRKVTAAERRVAELERDVDGYKQTVSLQYERGDRLAAVLAASEAKLGEARQALQDISSTDRTGWCGNRARAALRPAEEK